MKEFEVVINLGKLIIRVEAKDESRAEEQAIEQLQSSIWQSDVDMEIESVEEV